MNQVWIGPIGWQVLYVLSVFVVMVVLPCYWYVNGDRIKERWYTHRGAPARGSSTPQREVGQPPVQRLDLRAWLDQVNHRPDDIPHLWIEGGSGTGKTTFATAVLADRADPVAIVGVKPNDNWGGCPTPTRAASGSRCYRRSTPRYSVGSMRTTPAA